MSFIDNTAAQHALTKGSSRDPPVNALVGAFWAWTARRGAVPHFERVPSGSNWSDGVSRNDFSLAQQLGWIFADFDLAPLYNLLGAYLRSGSLAPVAFIQELVRVVEDIARECPALRA